MVFLGFSSMGLTLTGPSINQNQIEVYADSDSPEITVMDKRPNGVDSFQLDLDTGLQEIDPFGNIIFFIPSFSGESGLSFDGLTRKPVGNSMASCLKYSGQLSNGALFLLRLLCSR